MAKLYKREFLNAKEGTAFAEVSAETHEDYISADLKIADCDRVVTLDFGVWDRSNKDRRERIAKADRLITQLTLLRDFLKANPF